MTNLTMKMMKWIRNRLNKSNYKIEYILWDMEAERLMNLCRDTGGESSPYFYKLQDHLKRKPEYESS